MKNGSKLKYFIPLLFLTAYIVPISYLFIMHPFSLSFFSKMAGVIAFINIFTQVMLGAFRDFFKKLYNPLKVYWFHNYLGLSTLILVIVHIITKNFVLNNLASVFLLNSGLPISLGVIAFYLMALTVISSDIKYFFKISYNYKLWRAIHLLNYALFPIVYFHIFYLGTIFGSSIVYYLITGLLILASLAVLYRVLVSIKSIAK